MTQIYAPDPKATGKSWYGPVELDFHDGVAEVDGDLSDGLKHYLAAAGYGIDGPAPDRGDQEPAVDSRDVDVVEGNPLRDAAVDPHPEDFLPPVGAGEADPHGPHVVAPGVHAANMPKPIHPGPVGRSGNLDTPDTPDDPSVVKDTDAQSENESNLAAAVLIDRQPVPDATQAAAQVDPVMTDAKGAGAFDPAGHTVAEVNDYLAGADGPERIRVLTAEADEENGGKARTGILSGPYAESDD